MRFSLLHMSLALVLSLALDGLATPPLIAIRANRRQLVSPNGILLTRQTFEMMERFSDSFSFFWATTNRCDRYSGQILSDDGEPLTQPRYQLFDENGFATPPAFTFSNGAVPLKCKSPSHDGEDCDVLYPDKQLVHLGATLFGAYSEGDFIAIEREDGRMYLFDVASRRRLDTVIHQRLLWSGTQAIIFEDEMGKGLCLSDGTSLVPAIYDDILPCLDSKGVVWLIRGGFQQPYDVDGGWLLPIKVENGWNQSPNGSIGRNLKICRNGMWGIYSLKERKYVIRPKYNAFSWATHNAIVGLSDNVEVLISLENGRVLARTDGEILLKTRGLQDGTDVWEVRDKDGGFRSILLYQGKIREFESMRLLAQYQWKGPQLNLLFFVVLDNDHGRIGAISADGKRFVVPMKPNSNHSISVWDGKLLCRDSNANSISIIALDGTVLLPFSLNATFLGNLDVSGHAKIVCDGKAGLVDGDCRFVLPCRYEDVGGFAEGVAPAKLGGKWGFTMLTGKWAISPRYKGARSFRNGYAPVCVNGKWGFIDKSGKAATPFAYEDVKDVREGHFRAKIGGKWGIFALDGTCTLPAEYDDILAEGEPGYGSDY